MYPADQPGQVRAALPKWHRGINTIPFREKMFLKSVSALAHFAKRCKQQLFQEDQVDCKIWYQNDQCEGVSNKLFSICAILRGCEIGMLVLL